MNQGRLVHSLPAQIRAMQISSTSVFAFVEGKFSDPFVYGIICDESFTGLGLLYEVLPVDTLPGQAGGKKQLLSFFRYLKRKNALESELGGKKTLAIFFLDKDIDDIKRTRLRSPHVKYTRYYDVENHVAFGADVAAAVAIGCELDPGFCRRKFGAPGDWQRKITSLWLEWVTLCVLCVSYSIICGSNFGRLSPINFPLHGPIDASNHVTVISQTAASSGLAPLDFDALYTKIARKIRRYYSRGAADYVFKGKWYAEILASEVAQIAPYPIDSKALVSRLATGLRSQMDLSQPWVLDVVIQLRDFSAKCFTA